MTVRPLTDADRPALEALLAPTEARSVFLLGNARALGGGDQGGALQGTWLGSFDEGPAASLRGVVAYFHGPGSVVPACEGHGAALMPALAALVPTPTVLVGPRDRVAEALAHAPPTWRAAIRQRELLLVLTWDRFAPMEGAATALPLDRAPEAAALIAMLHGEAGLPTDDARNHASARRLAGNGDLFVCEVDGRAVAMSCTTSATGRYAHVGATVCAPEHRRRGLAGACVTAALRQARAQGRATEGATLFTGEDNHAALSLYARLGFRPEAAWELCFLAQP